MSIILLFSCSEDNNESDNFQIVATTTQAGDLTSILVSGMENISFTQLMGAGIDPHLYQPTIDDINSMNTADLIIYSGLHLEGQFASIFESLSEQGVKIYALSEAVERAGFVLTDSSGLHADPHFWFDPQNWLITTMDLANFLAELLPEAESSIVSKAEEYASKLNALDSWAESSMQSIPTNKSYVVSSHDAFRYFADAYGWESFSIQGLSTLDSAGVGDIQNTVEFVIEHRVPILFIESSIPPNTIRAVIEAIRSSGVSVKQGIHELYSDALGEKGRFAGTYIGMIAHNVYTILKSFELAGILPTIAPWPSELAPLDLNELEHM